MPRVLALAAAAASLLFGHSADDRPLRDWTRDGAGSPAGALYEYTTDEGTVARYWDDSSCACYVEAFLPDGSYRKLARWWEK